MERAPGQLGLEESSHILQALRYALGGTRDSTCSGMKLLVDMNLSPRWVSFFAASQLNPYIGLQWVQ